MTSNTERAARQQDADHVMKLLATVWAHPDQAERNRLLPILENELMITQEVMRRSPLLRKAGKPSTITAMRPPLPRLQGETRTEWETRVKTEIPWSVEWVAVVKTKYWELQSEHTGFWDNPIVYVRGRQLGTFAMKSRDLFDKDDPYWDHWNTSWINKRQPYDLDAKEMADVIQGLRLLRSP